MIGLRNLLLLIWLFAAQAIAAPPTAEVLRIGSDLNALRDVSRSDVEASLKVWANEMMKVLDVPAEVHFYSNVDEMRRDLKAGKINFVISDGVSLLRNFDPDELTDGFGGGGLDEDNMVLLARKNSGIRSEHDLRGKRVVLLSENDISDLILETTCLHQFHTTCAQSGVIVSREMRSRQQVLQLFFGKVDAALVRGYGYDLAAELNPQIRDQLVVIKRIHIYPSALGLFSTGVSQPFRDYVIGKAPLMQDYPRGRQILDVMQTSRVVRYPKTILDPIRDLISEHDELSRRYLKRTAAK
ncbi:MAG: PhnD/SsuA/transferrin family substrate-binding protein [Parasulfuritortus sp.]|nr:PhnD/SsuA/transferrin family substrate-binding protein [Parasulfuritortus sp.]